MRIMPIYTFLTRVAKKKKTMSFHKPNDQQNVGIINFFKSKTIFITGSTGFMGKVLVEKLLRALPSIEKIYLLVRANTAAAAKQRIKTEMIDSKLFKVLREQHGQLYEEFMWNKLVPIAGDVCKPYLGMRSDSAHLIREEVNVIVNISANTNWYDRYDVLLESNVSGAAKLVDFALDCTNLALFVQVSSAYASQDLPGVALEKPIDWGRYYIEDEQNKTLSVDKVINTEMRIVSELASQFHEEEQTVEMKKLAVRRAKFYKMLNSYTLTKAMGELLVTKLSGKLPVVIIRPSLMESTIKEPFPGWVEGYKSMDPIILSYGTGTLEGFVANRNSVIDVVPVDMAANAMIAAMAKHGNEGKHGLMIYNVTSSHLNPILCHDFFNFSTNYFTSNPLKDSNEKDIIVKDMKFFESMSEFIIIVGANATRINAKLQNQLLRMAAIYELPLTANIWFDDKNIRNLLEEMSIEELAMFNFNFKFIDWKDYFTNIHIPGLTQHFLMKKSLAARL
ncbi:fatty acyl-CoA reductase 2, chloroplastic-like [Silene latifolia]|uniref:fatty acyl-CoA reductase 2, chloroplastic-like n=1 Tax=Silene latifolia TaxID=37657 RepID=UPI003D7871CF